MCWFVWPSPQSRYKKAPSQGTTFHSHAVALLLPPPVTLGNHQSTLQLDNHIIFQPLYKCNHAVFLWRLTFFARHHFLEAHRNHCMIYSSFLLICSVVFYGMDIPQFVWQFLSPIEGQLGYLYEHVFIFSGVDALEWKCWVMWQTHVLFCR